MKDDAVEPLVIKFKPAGILLGNVSEILIHSTAVRTLSEYLRLIY